MLFKEGSVLSKYDLVTAARCEQRTAQRLLAKMYKEHVDICIVGWVKIYRQYIPVYGLGTKDKPKPANRDNAKYMRTKRKNDPEFYMRELAAKRKRYALYASKKAIQGECNTVGRIEHAGSNRHPARFWC
jgi:hypothetical protein